LTLLGLELLAQDDRSLSVRPPSWRSDLEREIDLIEEVARIHGYHHIAEDVAVPLTSAPRGQRERVESAVRSLLAGAGFDEAVTYSLVEDRLGAPLRPGPLTEPLHVDHSSRKRESALRQSLVPSLLAVRRHNEAHGQFDAELFEIANVYLPRPGQALPDEPARLGLVSGRDFPGLKGAVEALLQGIHAPAPLDARPIAVPLFAPGRAAELLIGQTHLGYLGEIDQAQLSLFELREPCTAAELEFDVLLQRAELVARSRPLPAFPAVVRDLSLVVARALQWSELCQTVVAAAGPTLESVRYQDTFRGGNIPEEAESVHFSMVFRHPERTLTGDEVECAVKSVVEACQARFHAELRT
jgi:phenylalanyl-tRNA synthetase beta chain